MSFIIYISKKMPPSERELDRLIGIHQTEQDSVIVKEDETIQRGFKVVRTDRTEIKKTEPELKEYLGIKDYKFKTRITASQNEQDKKSKTKNKS